MTSKSSFWVSVKENQKRRIWVWVIALLLQMINYLGTLMVYITRIRKWYDEGVYGARKEYQTALCEAARDALSFGDRQWLVVGVLATVIAMQGFSYLYDRRKVDLYHSVPVPRKARFRVIYLGGIVMYLLTAIVSLILGTVVAGAMGAVNSEVLEAVALGFVWNLLFFMVLYHAMILAVMLTGNWFVTLLVYGALNIYEVGIYLLLESFKSHFFRTVSTLYVTVEPKLSPLYDYYTNIYQLKSISGNPGRLLKMILPYCGKWIMIAVGLLAAAYFLYDRRASESAGRAIACRKVEPVFKVACAIPLSAMVGMIVYEASYNSASLMAVSMVVSGLLFCGVMEILYDFDLRSAVKHLISTGVAFIGILAVFFIFEQDLLGYDQYIPRADQIESMVVSFDCDYQEYFEETETGINYIGKSDYHMEHMFITDVEPVLALAQKSLQEEWSEMKDGRSVNVVYRLKSGRRVGRCFTVDFDNPVNAGYLDEILGSTEYQDGMYQSMTEPGMYDRVSKITYSNGVTEMTLPAEDIRKLIELWNTDMRQMNFSRLHENYPCGSLTLTFKGSYFTLQWPVYESFGNTIYYLREQGAYYPIQLEAKDIESISITNYHHELYDNSDVESGVRVLTEEAATEYDEYVDRTVMADFYDEEEIAEILENIYPTYEMNTTWNSYEGMDQNYDVQVSFKPDTTYPYRRGAYYFSFQFFDGKVPEFVEKATALQ